MKTTLRIAALLLAGLMLYSCGSQAADTTTPAATTEASTTEAPPPSDPVASGLTLTYKPKSGSAKEATGETSAEVSVNSFKAGDKITVTLPEGQHYLAFCLADGAVEETILYLPKSTFNYTVQNVSVSYPDGVRNSRKIKITARIPSADELTASRNLACNPADLESNKNAYPHAITTNVHDKNNENNRLQFEARNAIDGFTQNNGHGYFPYQSWGPGSNMSTKDTLKIDFGREVSLTEIIVYLRADFPHDTYWDSCTVKFSDGSSQELTFTKTANAQSIKLDAAVTTTYITFTNFNKVAGSDWAAWMEVQAIGSDIVG